MRRAIAPLALLLTLALLVTWALTRQPEPDRSMSPSVAAGPDRLGLADGEADASKLRLNRKNREKTVERLVDEANTIAGVDDDAYYGAGAVTHVLRSARLLPERASAEDLYRYEPGAGAVLTVILCESGGYLVRAYLVVAGLSFTEYENGPSWRPSPSECGLNQEHRYHPAGF